MKKEVNYYFPEFFSFKIQFCQKKNKNDVFDSGLFEILIIGSILVSDLFLIQKRNNGKFFFLLLDFDVNKT